MQFFPVLPVSLVSWTSSHGPFGGLRWPAICCLGDFHFLRGNCRALRAAQASFSPSLMRRCRSFAVILGVFWLFRCFGGFSRI